MIVFAPIGRGAMRLWSVTPVLLLEAFVIFLWLWKANNTKGYHFRRTPLDIPIIIFAMLAVLSFIFSVYKHASLYALIRLFGYIGIYYVIVNEFDTSMKRGLLITAISVASALSVYGLLQYLGILNHSWWIAPDLLAATYVNHNHFAGYLEIAIPVTIAMLMSPDTAPRAFKPMLISALIAMAAAFILSQSRGAWISLAVSLAIVGVVFRNGKKPGAHNIFIIFLLVLIVASLLYSGREIISARINPILFAESPEASAVTRFQIWQGTIGLIGSHPLTGSGIGTFAWAFPRFRPGGLNVQSNFAHNDYLEVTADMGLAAFFAMLWILITLVASGIRAAPRSAVSAGCVAGVLSLSLHGLVDFNFHIPANMILFTVCAAIVVSASNKED